MMQDAHHDHSSDHSSPAAQVVSGAASAKASSESAQSARMQPSGEAIAYSGMAVDIPADVQVSQTGADCSTLAQAGNKGRVSILVIEDDIDTGSLITDALNDHFHNEVVMTVRSLCELGAIMPRRFDMVLCDYNLPDGNGLDALKMLKVGDLPAPFVLVTGQNEIRIALEALELGAYDYIVKSTEFISLLPLMVEKNLSRHRIKEENFRLQRELEHSLEQIRESHGQLTSLVSQLESMALTDELTGLSNRRHLNDVLPTLFAQSQRYDTDLTCIMIDLDGFKQINDSLGHQQGDDLLRLTGRLISANRRDADFAARFGGDEFVILMPQTSQETARNLAQRLMTQYREATEAMAPHLSPIGLSAGIASVQRARTTSGEHLLQLADKALLRAKASGKARTATSDAGSDTCSISSGATKLPEAGKAQHRKTA